MLKVKNVYVGYSENIDVVKNISFEVHKNKNLCIIGPNGCGKTTLLKAIANLMPFRGEIEIDGKSVKKMSHKEIAAKMAMMSQTAGVYFSYSVFDTVMMGRYSHIKDGLFGLPSKEDKECVTECLAAVNLLEEKDREITKLSGGQLQRVFLARTLAQSPSIILLDEPTNHLDLKYQIELIEYLRRWSEKKDNVVVGVMHDINLAMRLSENFVVMKEGRAEAYGETDKIITGGLLERVYEVDVAGYMREFLKKWKI